MTTDTFPYDSSYYDVIDATAVSSARSIVPWLLATLAPRSVMDVGCGRGAWLSVVRENGVDAVTGCDGTYVSLEELRIPRECFHGVDLGRPFELPGSHDLAMCLEVAEHLPLKMSRKLVEQLTLHAPVVLFSAAVPEQRGTQHVNEQWHEFWTRLFDERDFQVFDVIRPRVFNDHSVAWYYRQNMFLYAKRGSDFAATLCEHQLPGRQFQVLAAHVAAPLMSFKGLVKMLPSAFWRDVRNRIAGMGRRR
jgi:SAM-dependent methyltransferase